MKQLNSILALAAALAIPGTASDIPRRIEVTAGSGEATLEVTFELDDYALIGVPNDNDAGFTSISETHGRASVTGRPSAPCKRGNAADCEQQGQTGGEDHPNVEQHGPAESR